MTSGKSAIWMAAAVLAVACTGCVPHGDPRPHLPPSPRLPPSHTDRSGSKAVKSQLAPTSKPGLAGVAKPWLAPATGPGHLAPRSRPAALPADVLVADHL